MSGTQNDSAVDDRELAGLYHRYRASKNTNNDHSEIEEKMDNRINVLLNRGDLEEIDDYKRRLRALQSFIYLNEQPPVYKSSRYNKVRNKLKT